MVEQNKGAMGRRRFPPCWLALVLAGALACVLPPAAGAAGKAAKCGALVVEILTSTGEKHRGQFAGFSGGHIHLKVNGRRRNIFWPNVIRLELVRAGEDPEPTSGDPLAVGRALLKRGLRGLAAAQFALAVEAEPQRAPAVQGIYTAAKIPLPPQLQPGGTDEKTRRKTPRRKYTLATPRQVAYTLETADRMAGLAKRIAESSHLIETAHFRIYSSWPESNDRKLKEIYERLYRALCRQFDIDPRENIWIGKLSVFAFWARRHFVRFSIQALKIERDRVRRAGGFAAIQRSSGGDFQLVVLGPVTRRGMSKARARTWFYELLTHESSHAFMARFINGNRIPNWVDEGIAEAMASTLVPGSSAGGKVKASTRQAVREKRPIEGIFDVPNIPMDPFHYGIAQSVVRYLIKLKRKQFIEFIRLLKSGLSDREALQQAYGLTRRELVLSWHRAAAKKFKR